MAMADPRASEAVKVALDMSATQESRNAATAFLDQLKSGDVRVLGATAFELSREDNDQPLEVTHQGLKLFQHLIRIRWDELTAVEKQATMERVMGMVHSFSERLKPWSLKIQTAALAAEIARREGPALWQNMLDNLFALGRNGPVQAEMVAMVLWCLPEEVIVHNDDLEAEKRRALLAGLKQHLPAIMPFIFEILRKHYVSAMEIKENNIELARLHANAVTAGLNALLAYVEWAPVDMFFSCGILDACRHLLTCELVDFRMPCCKILKQLASRKKPDDEELIKPFNEALIQVFEALSQAYHQSGSSTEYAQCICEALVTFGLQNLQSIACDEQKLMQLYNQMIVYLRHPDFSLHAQVLPFWLTVIRDSITDLKSAPKPGRMVVRADITAAVLEEVSNKLAKHGSQHKPNEESDDNFPSVPSFSQYRGRLIELIRAIASVNPGLALKQMSDRLDATLAAPVVSNLESSLTMLEAVVAGMVTSPNFAELHSGIASIMGGVRQKLLYVQWSEPELVEMHAKFFVALGPYLRTTPGDVCEVIQKLFALLGSVPVALKDDNSSGRKARVQVCTSFLRLAKASNPAFVPHIQFISETMTTLQQNGSLLRSEHIVLGEALLVAAGPEQQSNLLYGLLGPFRERWIQIDWQVTRLIHTLSEPDITIEGLYVESQQDLWYVYHSIGFFEKAIRRTSKSPDNSQTNPMAAHITWILPRLIQFLRCLHSLWSPQLLLPATIRKALAMGVLEQAAFLGENTTRPADKEDELRNWLKGVRDSGYNILGFASSRIGEPLFNMTAEAAPLATCLVENLDSMEFRHFRLLIHSVITPFVKNCPREHWATWLGPLLPEILNHCNKSLPEAWNSLIKGNVKTSTLFAEGGSSGLKTEVIEERILRELTREVCNLLAALASPELNQNQPEQKGILLFILQYGGQAALSALNLAVESLQWPDSEVVHKSAAFCMAVTNLAMSLNEPQLHDFVGRHMFFSVIQSLTHESHATAQVELLGLLREILVGLSPVTSAPRDILMQVNQQDFMQFDNSFSRMASAKEQRQLLKSLLLAGRGEYLKALKPQRNILITNVNSLTSNQEKRMDHNVDDGGPIGLANFLS